MKLAEAYMDIIVRMGRLKGDLNRARGMVKRFAKRTSAWLNRSRMAFMALAAGAFAVVKAVGIQDKANRRLTASLKMIGKYSDTAYQDLKKFASAIQSVTTYGDEAVQDLMSLGITLGKLSGTGLKKATKAAIGLAEVIGTDARTAMMLLARAAQGQFQLFTRYGIVLDKFNTKQEKFAELLRLGAAGFKIQEEKAEGLAGLLTRVANAFGDVLEQIGFMFDPKGLKGLVGLLEQATKNIKDLRYLLKLPVKETPLKDAALEVSYLNDEIENLRRHIRLVEGFWRGVFLVGDAPKVFTRDLRKNLDELLAKRKPLTEAVNKILAADAETKRVAEEAGKAAGRAWGKGLIFGAVGLAGAAGKLLAAGREAMPEGMRKWQMKQYETNRSMIKRIAELRFKAAGDELGLRRWALNEETNYLLKQGKMRKDLVLERHRLEMQAIGDEERKKKQVGRAAFTNQWWYWKRYLEPMLPARKTWGVISGRDVLRQRHPERFNLGAGGGKHDELTALQKIEKHTEKTAEAIAGALISRYN